jgi:hypothetical protein
MIRREGQREKCSPFEHISFSRIGLMPASFAALAFANGTPSLHCPATGRLVASSDDGLDTDAPHTPHLRFALDALGNCFVVDPEVLPASQAEYQRRVVQVFSRDAGQFESQDDLVAACVAAMPSTAIVFEMLEPPQGSSDGWVAYFGFDLAPQDEEGRLNRYRWWRSRSSSRR